jgi:hypothetical protein
MSFTSGPLAITKACAWRPPPPPNPISNPTWHIVNSIAKYQKKKKKKKKKKKSDETSTFPILKMLTQVFKRCLVL